MSSFLEVKEGIYDPTRRFAFTNIDTEPFAIHWGGKDLAILKPNETTELPHYLAVKCTGELVDRIMMAKSLAETRKKQEINPMYTAPNIAGNMGVPAARKPYEDRIVKELSPDQQSPQFRIYAMEKAEEIAQNIQANNAAPAETIAFQTDNLKGTAAVLRAS